MDIQIRLLHADDIGVLSNVAAGVFDGPVDPQWSRVFFGDARHHMVVALEGAQVIGMVSAVDYVHPDKAPQLWINELGVAPSHQQRGIGRKLIEAMLQHGQTLGCTEAWLGTEHDNVPARKLYERVGSTAEPFVLYSFDLPTPLA